MAIRESRLYLVHSRVDKRFTTRLARRLRARGRDVWFAQWALLDDVSSFEEIVARVPDRCALGVVLSPASQQAACFRSPAPGEMSVELARRGVFALLIRTGDCAPPAALAGLRCADFCEDYALGLDTLLASLWQSVPLPGSALAPPERTRVVVAGSSGNRERSYFEHILRQCKGDITQAARVAGMDSESFHAALRRAGVDPLKFRS